MIPSRSTLAVAAALLLAATTASAVPLANGFTGQPFLDTTLPGTTELAQPALAGLVLADVDTSFSLNGVTGYVQNRVVREFGSGTLDFYWRVVVDPTASGSGIAALRIGDFGYGYLTNADWRIDGVGSVAPTTGRLFNPATNPGGDLNFLFDGTVDAGESSYFAMVHTGATAYAETGLYDVTNAAGAITGTFDTFAPAVPEPAPSALLGLGLLTLAGLRARRQRK